MLFSEINPYIRFARYLDLAENSHFDEWIPLDARLFYVIDGFYKIKVCDTLYEMCPHSLIIINSGVPYKIIAPDFSANCIAINFDYTQNASKFNLPIQPVDKSVFNKDMLVDFKVFEDADMLNDVLYIKDISSVQKMLISIVSEYTKKLLYHENKSAHLLATCLAECMRCAQSGNTNNEKEATDKILSYIHENFRKNIDNQTIGSIFNYHPNYVSFLIKRMTGMPVHQYIIHIRLLNAAKLLENTSLSCEEIATSCGFGDSAYFSRYFKNHFGVSPSKYRSI